eukprot:TRINITY_DN27756_c0_g1_i1.p1 TRINITY_DN27756_c0_g1~~TRINITY_DN27756_c0_g1_i1.p1  ORF type:complete len:785 (+),score=101.75 TRINITY_DN27756_c0_g1_i1:74-2428(+)
MDGVAPTVSKMPFSSRCWARSLKLLLLLCTLACPVLKPPPSSSKTGALTEAYCSKSQGSQPANLSVQAGRAQRDKRGFGISIEECKLECLQHEGCKHYSHGVWEKGLFNVPFLSQYFGQERCQLYSHCVDVKKPGLRMAIYAKPTILRGLSRQDFPWLLQMAVNMFALFESRFTCVAAVIAAFEWGSQADSTNGLPYIPTPGAFLHASSLLFLVMLEFSNRQTVSEEHNNAEKAIQEQVLHKSEAVVRAHVSNIAEGLTSRFSVPSWREEECRTPPHKLLCTVMCAFLESPGLIRIAKMPICTVAGGAGWLDTFKTRALALFSRTGVEVCAPQMLVLPLITLTILWWCAILLLASLPDHSHAMILPTCSLGVIIFALQVGLALTYASQRPASTMVGAAMHFLVLALVCHCWAERRKAHKRVMEKEKKRSGRERDLIALLIDRVQPESQQLVNSCRWYAMVDICVGAVFLTVSFYGVVQLGEDIVNDHGIMQFLGSLIGFNTAKALRYLIMFGGFAIGGSLLSLFFLKMISGMQGLCSSPFLRRAEKLKQLAVQTAEWAARTERKILQKSADSSTPDAEHVIVCAHSPRNDEIERSRKFKKPDFDVWVEDMAQHALAYRLNQESWSLDELFAREEESKRKFGEDFRHSADQTSANIGSLFTVMGKLGERFAVAISGSLPGGALGKLIKLGLYLLLGCVLFGVALMVSRALTSPSAGGSGHPTAAANPACAEGAMQFGGVLALGAAAVLAVPGVGPAGLALVEIAGAFGAGGLGGFGHFYSCYGKT